MQPLGFGSELKRLFSDLKVEDLLHREKQTMAVSHFFLLSSVICRITQRKTSVQGKKKKKKEVVLLNINLLIFLLPPRCPSLTIIGQIPRIILTHPSTSDEDVELLTHSPGTEPPNAFDIPDRCVCFDSAFYAP